ncbi:MAG: ABC transporter ATP-binding protein [Proteobacteria bacterium]|nr:ABC transporter ATP-binding protein [Pseudomonadota bacterium]
MIKVNGLSRYYGDFAAIKDLSFEIKNNQVVGFLGLNGAGKSTTLKILAGLLSPSGGSVQIHEKDLLTAPASFRKNIGYLPEDAPLYKDMTVSDFLTYLAKIRGYGVPPDNVQDRMKFVLDVCQLKGMEHRIIDELSLGYKKRVGIAQAIFHRPRLVILDEPISGLDPKQIVEMRQVIRKLTKDAIVLLSSHNLNEIAETCDQLMVLHQGELVAQGPTEQLLNKSAQTTFNVEATLISNEQNLEEVLNIPNLVLSCKLSNNGETTTAKLSLSSPPENLVAHLVQKGVGVRSITTSIGELEQLFLSLTQK